MPLGYTQTNNLTQLASPELQCCSISNANQTHTIKNPISPSNREMAEFVILLSNLIYKVGR